MGREGAVSPSSCPVRAILENSWGMWTGGGLTSDLGACGWSQSIDKKSQKAGDRLDQLLKQRSREGEAASEGLQGQAGRGAPSSSGTEGTLGRSHLRSNPG